MCPPPGPVSAGIAWPPVREFERKLTPGTEMERAAPRRLTAGEPGAVPVPARGYDTLGAVDQRIVDTEKHLSRLHQTEEVKQARTNLASLRLELMKRVPDPEVQNLLKDYSRTKQASAFLWGSDQLAKRRTGPVADKRMDTLLDDNGQLTWKGYRSLVRQLQRNGPRMGGFDRDELAALGTAFNYKMAEGGVIGREGEGLGGMLVAALKALKAPLVGGAAMGAAAQAGSKMPGATLSPGARLSTQAIRAITGKAPVTAEEMVE